MDEEVAAVRPHLESAPNLRTTHAKHMRKQPREKQIRLMYKRLMKKRDVLRSKLSAPSLPEQHVNIAVLEAWADGIVDESHVLRQIAKVHGTRTKCARCGEAVEFYRRRREQILSAV